MLRSHGGTEIAKIKIKKNARNNVFIIKIESKLFGFNNDHYFVSFPLRDDSQCSFADICVRSLIKIKYGHI
jgi:hypothetical protein